MKSLICALLLVPSLSFAQTLVCAKQASETETLYMKVNQVIRPTLNETGNVDMGLYKNLIRDNVFPKDERHVQSHVYDVFKTEVKSAWGGMVVFGKSERVDNVSIDAYFEQTPENIEAHKKMLLELIEKADYKFNGLEDTSRLYLNNADGSGSVIDFRFPLSANPIVRHEKGGARRLVFRGKNEQGQDYRDVPNQALAEALNKDKFVSEECDNKVVGRMRSTKTNWGFIYHTYENVQDSNGVLAK